MNKQTVMLCWGIACVLAGALEALGAGPGTARIGQGKTPLDEYVEKPDPNYRFERVRTIPGKGFQTHVLEMTSQQWLTTNEVDQPVWKHWLVIVQPDKVRHTEALLFIGGGNNRGDAPSHSDEKLAQIAVATGSVVAELKMVPNQPLRFAGDDESRYEDSLIAFTWDKYLRTGDSKWPARLPMTKAAVRAMDTITAFCATAEGGSVQVQKFIVAGGSKRGWTTWTTGAVDARVIAIVPIVIDMLNVVPSFMHHFGAYGFYAPAVGDYVAMGIMEWQGTDEYTALLKIVEPYEYRDRLTMPKFLINATGDQFFLPDSSQFYWGDLKGPKYLRYVPNGDHSLRDTDAVHSLLAFYNAIIQNAPLPEFTWKFAEDGTIRVTAKTVPAEVRLWQATNPTARDFRLEIIGPAWRSAKLEPGEGGTYIGKADAPAEGWTAFLVELTFANETGPAPFKFTSGVRVTPDKLPFKYEAPAVHPKEKKR